MVILSRQNPAVKALAALKEKKGRERSGTFLVEGAKMVRECRASGMRIVQTVVREDYAGEREEGALVLGKDAFAAVSDEKTPQGILAEVEIPEVGMLPPAGRCLLLDGVADPANVGAIIRTAVAAGYPRLYLAGCADPYSPKSVRASMSGVFFAEIVRGGREEILTALDGFPLLIADMGGSDAFTFTPPREFCLVIGNEGSGVSEAVRARASHAVKIPMGEHTESLNAAVSAGILMYCFRQRQ